MRRLPLLVVGSVLAVVALVMTGVVVLTGRGAAPTGAELAPISVQPAGPTGAPAPTAAPDPGGTVPPPPAGDRDDRDHDRDDGPGDDGD